jgi:hypothetical protein
MNEEVIQVVGDGDSLIVVIKKGKIFPSTGLGGP